ncbi:MAG: bifunctional adenosylcobinamide kinase/adenosylcobinamide-phosphate guanylyltransferase [Lachnospiraceae bacterium]|nr:bifunctional adenosylcobinamide kinase/adenosylcobinamide-phosphate guanylyltransferase [Lachnospiraceae bacterium]
MILITGGKYQGKLRRALEMGRYSEEDYFDFNKVNSPEYVNRQINYADKKVWYNIQEYIRILAYQGTEALQIESMIKKLVDKHNPEVLIIAEVGSGVIPVNKADNDFREATGRVSVYFAEEAEEVYRIVCGMKVQLK